MLTKDTCEAQTTSLVNPSLIPLEQHATSMAKKWVGETGQVFSHCQSMLSSCLNKQASLWQDLANGDDVGVGIDHPHLWALLRSEGRAGSAQHTQGRAQGQLWEGQVSGQDLCPQP